MSRGKRRVERALLVLERGEVLFHLNIKTVNLSSQSGCRRAHRSRIIIRAHSDLGAQLSESGTKEIGLLSEVRD